MITVAPSVPLKSYLNSPVKETVHKVRDWDERVKMMGFMGSIGAVTGFMAGLFGVGGGSITVPALSLTTGMDHYTALGTSMTAFVLPSLVGTLQHYRQGNVVFAAAIPLACGTFLGSFVGGKHLAPNVDEEFLRLSFSDLPA